jgi:hypothetical protein
MCVRIAVFRVLAIPGVVVLRPLVFSVFPLPYLREEIIVL